MQVAPWEMVEEGETAAEQQRQHVPFCGDNLRCHELPGYNHGQHSLIASPAAEVMKAEVRVESSFASTCIPACYCFAV